MRFDQSKTVANTAVAAFILMTLTANSFTAASGGGGDPPPVIESVEPTELISGSVPQPDIQVFGTDLVIGLPTATNRPTVTLRHVDGIAEFSTLAWVNFAGTMATVTYEQLNLIAAPMGEYDVILTRPDKQTDTLEAAFEINDGLNTDGPQLNVQSAWGGPVNDVAIVGDLAYAAIGRRLVVIDLSDEMNPVEIGSLYIRSGVVGVAVSGDYAFLGASKPYRFTVVDISDPTNPVLVSAGQGELGQFPQDVHLYGNLVYVRSSTDSFQAFDITSPTNVIPLGGVAVGSSVNALTIIGDLLYVGTGELAEGEPSIHFLAFRVYDLAADPLNPPMIGEVQFNVSDPKSNPYGGGFTRAIAVEGDYAVWTLRKDDIGGDIEMLLVVDISNPASPNILGTHNDGSNSYLTDVVISNGLAYAADAALVPQSWAGAKGLTIFDIATDPTNPTIISTFKTHGDVRSVRVVGDRAYLLDQGEGLIILDVSDPANPVRLGNYHSPSTLRETTKVGDLLYVTDAWNGFTVLDVSDAAHPEVVSVYLAEHYHELGVNAWGITIKDDLAYLGAGHLGFEVVDVSDPSNPTFVEAFRVPLSVLATSRFVGVAVSGDVAQVGFEIHVPGSCGSSLLTFDLSNLPDSITQLSELQTGGCAPPLTIELNDQSIAFIGREGSQLIVDTSDPAEPILLLNGSEIGDAIDVALASNLLYSASEDGGGSPGPTDGIWVQDVTDPANPIVLAHIDESTTLAGGVELTQAYAVATQNQWLYVVGRGTFPGAGGIPVIYVFDVSDPTTPEFLNVVPYVGGGSFGTSAASLLVDEPYQYVANGIPNAGNGIGLSGLIILEIVGINPADLDGDGIVNTSDLLILFANWGPCPPKGDCPADLDGDGTVGISDLLELFANWG